MFYRMKEGTDRGVIYDLFGSSYRITWESKKSHQLLNFRSKVGETSRKVPIGKNWDVSALATSLHVKTTKKSEINPVILSTHSCSGFRGFLLSFRG